MKRIPKKVREEAAFCCQAAASTPWSRDDIDTTKEHNAPFASISQFAWSNEVEELATAAWDAVIEQADRNGTPFCDGSEPWAEAESWLRTGWCPDE